MATIKEIKPAGGGDYTTLQAAEDWNDGEALGRYDWVCSGGGDMGAVTISGWPTQDAANYLYVYNADGEEHDGSDATSGAYALGTFTASISFVRVEGLGIKVASQCVDAGGVVDNVFTMTGCLIHCTGGAAAAVSLDSQAGGGSSYGIVRNFRNNLVINEASQSSLQIGGGGMGGGTGGDPPHATGDIQNNTFYGGGSGVYVLSQGLFAAHSSAFTIENNIAMNATTDYSEFTTGSGSNDSTYNNNLSEDATADDWGGSGHVINETTTDVFTAPFSDDFTLKSGSAAFDAGKTIGAVTDDIIGTARPQGDAYDIGAFETVVVVAEEEEETPLITGTDVLTEISSSNQLVQGGLRVTFGGIVQDGEKRDNDLTISAQVAADRLTTRFDNAEYYGDNTRNK
jgi:hypothetical protein